MCQHTQWIGGRPAVAVPALGQGAPLTDWLVIGPFSLESDYPFPRRLHRELAIGHAGETPPRFWAWAKLMCNRYRDYKPVPGSTA